MKTTGALHFLRTILFFALFLSARLGDARPFSIGANTAGNSYDPVSGIIYYEMRAVLATAFPGTAFTSLPSLSGDLSRFDLIILNRFSSQDLAPAEQAAIQDYVLQGGNLLYVGEAIGASNDSFTFPFGISMAPDPATNVQIAYAAYSNPGHPYLSGPFGMPASPPSGSYAAKVITLGPSVELARWDGGGVAISAFARGTLAPGAGFGIFLTDVNMMTPGRYSREVGPMISNALITLPAFQPNLEITMPNGNVNLAWDRLAIGWILQRSDDLVSWSDIGGAITAAGSHGEAAGGPQRFFRLRR